jgi:hypothetical protein
LTQALSRTLIPYLTTVQSNTSVFRLLIVRAGGWIDMKAMTTAALMTVGLAVGLMAETFTGVVMDQKCSGDATMKTNADCIKKCIQGGSPAVLVTADGKVYKIANQDKVLASAGKNVSVDGKLAADTITVATVAPAKE